MSDGGRRLMRGGSVLVLVVCNLAVAGCTPEDGNPPMLYQQGEYQGKADQQLSAQDVRKLQERAEMQKF